LFESILVFENYPVDSSLMNEDYSLELSEIEGFEQTNYPLTVLAVPGNELLVKISYDTADFEETTMGRMLGHLQTIFAAIAENPQQTVGELPLLSAGERHQLLVEWNETTSEYPTDKCIHQLFESQVEKTPDAVAVVFENQQLTYRELNQRANQLAHHLQTLGVGPEILVGICVERSLEMVVGLLGILKAGGAYLPLDPNYPQERLDYMLVDAGVEVLLTQQDLLSSLSAHTAQVVCLDTDCYHIAQDDQKNPISDVISQNLAYTIYTSGSTGKPKGVQIIHSAVVNFLYTMRQQIGITADDVLVGVTTFNFDIAMLEIFLPMIVGARVVIAKREVVIDGQKLLEMVVNCGATVMQATPATWRLLLEAGWQNSHQLKILCGGEALDWELANQLLARSTSLWNLYGPTETTIWSLIAQIESQSRLIVIGRPISNTQIYILDANLQPVPIGVPGELYIGGDGLARGYLNRPELTLEKFIPNPFSDYPSERLYKTGDLARYLADGNIEYLGRIDNQVKIRGFRIELGEIETVLNTHPQIQQTVVIAIEDIPGNKRLVAYVVKSDDSITTYHLREFLQQKLPEYMVPSTFVTLDTIPLTPNGKIDKKALPVPDGVAREVEYIAPRTPREEIIANIFATVLNLQNVGTDDNFFTLGGHSLLATQLISRLRQAFSLEIPLRTVFESPTVTQLDVAIAQLRSQEQGLTLPPIQAIEGDREQLPLSWAQERLWFLNQLEGISTAYNIPAAVSITGDLDINALQQALSAIVQRHEILRTSIQTVNGTPKQVIQPQVTMNINVVNLQLLLDSERQTQVEQQTQLEAHTPFSLENAPLIRCNLLQISARKYVLLLTMHHIVSDGWSMGIFISELSSLYPAFCAGAASPLPELPLQYADFAVWQKQWLTGVVLETQLNYWRSQLQGSPELLQLPTDRPRPVVQTYDGRTQSFELNQDLTQKLQSLSSESGTTLFMTLLATFATLLYRYSGQSDILVGSPIANRNHREIEPLIGFFVNTLVLRTNFADNPSFENLLLQVRETTLQAYEHQDVPFEQVVEALQPQRSLSHSPLFQVMFVLQNIPITEFELPGVTLTQLDGDSTIAKFDLTLSMSQTDQGLVGSWEYNTGLFDGSTIERMTAHFQNLLSAIVENPATTVGELPLLSAAERHQLLVEWNDTAAEYPTEKCIHQLFEEQVEKTPDAVAVVFEDQQLTYRELNQRANQLAHHLQTLGVRPEVLVGICVERSLEMVVGLLGILKAGGAYVPLDPHYPQERLDYMLADSGVEVLLTQQLFVERLPKHNAQLVLLDTDWQLICQSPPNNPITEIQATNLAYVIYTSGSTGQPKGVAMNQLPLCNLIWWHLEHTTISGGAKTLQFAPLSFDVSFQEIFSTWCSGGTLFLITEELRRDAVALLRLLEEKTVERLFLPFVGLQQLAEVTAGSKSVISNLREIITAGEQLQITPAISNWLSQLTSCTLHNHYGPSESHVVTTFNLTNPVDSWPLLPPIGRPIVNTQIYILDNNLQPVPIGVSGELHIGGVALARGYFNRPDLTQEKFISNPFTSHSSRRVEEQRGIIGETQGQSFHSERLYKTGDLARYLPDGNIEYIGRIDNQVKIRGFRIELAEIETVLNTHSQIKQAVVIATEQIPGNKRLVAYVVASDKSLTINQQRDFLKQKLPGYMIPSAFITLDTLPLTPNGKIDKKALPSPDGVSGETKYVAPRTATELQLTQIWSSVINITPVGVQDNFFELGGHSLLAVSLMSQIQQHFQVNLPLATLFQSPTIEQLAHLLNSSTNSLLRSALVPIKSNGNQPPLFCIHPAGGNVLCYQHLASYLSSEQPFYGLQSVGLNPQNEPHTSIEQMATHYIQELQAVQPHGPYFLSGWSLGGLVAFEMAQQLSCQGEQIALLALLDSYSFSVTSQEPEPEEEFARLVELLNEELDLCLEQLRELRPEEQLIYVVEQAKQKNLLPQDFDLAQADRLVKIDKLNIQAAKNYKPQYYSGSIVLFQASETDADAKFTWNKLVENIETYVVPGNHQNMVEPPHVHTLAQKLQKSLEQAQTNQ
jgi:amino acid adenylation domain-containing protein